jgi:hypothetical protein
LLIEELLLSLFPLRRALRAARRSGDRIHIPMTRLSAATRVHTVTAYLLQQIRLIAFAVDRASSTE